MDSDDSILTKIASARSEAPTTGPEAILYALQNIDMDKKEQEARADLKSGKKTRRPKAIALLNIAEGLKRNDITPSDYMIHTVPVIPAKMRPFSSQGDVMIPGDANILYKDLIDIKEAYGKESELFGEENMGKARLGLYDAVKSVYGYGDAVKPKTRAKDVQGFMKKITGSTAKYGYVQRKLLSKTQDNTGRSTIVVDPNLGIDDIGLPKEMALKIYAPHVQRRLVRKGFKPSEALEAVADKKESAFDALQEEIKTRPVMYSRAPAWHMHNTLGGKVTLRDGKAIAVNPLVTTGMNGDFDGDAINTHVPASDAAVKETYEKLMPSKAVFSNREEGKIIPLPKQEQILGLYSAATAPKTSVVKFSTEAEALSAIKRGDISLDTDIEIG